MRLFHVKLLFLVLLGSLFSTTQAAVNRCVGADGKVSFSDQPCAASQQGGAVQIKPAAGSAAGSPAGTAAGKSTPDAMALRREEFLRELSPICRELQGKITTEAAKPGAEKAMTDPSSPMAKQWKEQCEAQARAATERINARAIEKAKAEQIKSETCATQRDVLTMRRPILPTLSPGDRKAYESLDQEYRRNCL
jgi:Domain of unknown function (DUF4124)